MNIDEKRKPTEIKPRRKEESPREGLSKVMSFVEITKTGVKFRDTAWLDMNGCISRGDLGMLKYGVVGNCESQPVKGLTLPKLEAWAKRAWRLKGNMLFYTLNQNLLYMEFDLAKGTKRVMENGSRIYKGNVIHLEWWNPSVGCVSRKDQTFEA